MADIYETIWNHPASHVSVSRRADDQNWIDPNADVLLDEQGKATGCSSEDVLDRPLIAQVNEAILQTPTFRTLIALLDNYTAREAQPEPDLTSAQLRFEIDAFLDAVFATEPMGLALEYIQAELEPGITADDLRDRVRQMWFEPYTNEYGSPEPYCVGFEHVFVGEDETTPDHPPSRCRDAVGGYHSWVKYYLDQKAGKVTYLGHDYPNDVADQGVAEPNVATVFMTWHPGPEDGGAGHELLKRPGGFFVGTRPECEIALGTVGLLEVLANRFDQGPSHQEDHRRVQFGDSFYDLVLHPQTIRQGSRKVDGPRIRTLYPKFRSRVISPPPNGNGNGDIQVPNQPHNNGPVRITQAMPNPVGTTDAGEWVELVNVTEAPLDLEAWFLADQNKRVHHLQGSLAPGDSLREDTRTDDPESMQLRNSGGWILLYEGDQRRAAVSYGRADQGEVIAFS